MGFEPVIITWFVSLAIAAIKLSMHLKVTGVLYFELWRHAYGFSASQHLKHGHAEISGTFFSEVQL